MGAAAKKIATQKKSPVKDAEPKEVNLLKALPTPEAAAAELKSPYPDGVQFFPYQPKDGGAPILLAVNGFDLPDKLWFFDVSQLPRLAQTWKWMDRAKVPKGIQRRAQMLSDAEYFEMFDQWFETMKTLQGGGPKGAVTAGK